MNTISLNFPYQKDQANREKYANCDNKIFEVDWNLINKKYFWIIVIHKQNGQEI